MQSARNDGVLARVICDERAWDSIRPDWDGLYAASPWASTPLDFDWLRGWWQVYGRAYGAGGLRIVTIWRRSRLVGALPLYLGRGRGGPFGVRQLRFISTGEAEFEETCPDYLNLLCWPGDEEACVAAAWREIGKLAWDHLDLSYLPENSPLLRTPAGTPVAERPTVGEQSICPVADLGDGFEAYLGRLSANSRQRARQCLRLADRRMVGLELATELEVDEFFDDLVRLHQERWTAEGKPGCFAASRFTEFHRRLVRCWLPRGRAVLARLSQGGQVLGALYGFITGSKFDFYQSGFKRGPNGVLVRPGTTAHLLLMNALIARGVTEYDFLRGAAPYKAHLSTRTNPLVGLQIWRPTPRSALCRSIRTTRHVLGTGLRWAGRR